MDTPIKSIRKKCLDCSPDSKQDIVNCSDSNCSLFEYRLGKRPVSKKSSKMKAIRKYCLFCMNNQPNEIKLCTNKECSLYFYRMGKNPNCKGNPDIKKHSQHFSKMVSFQ